MSKPKIADEFMARLRRSRNASQPRRDEGTQYVREMSGLPPAPGPGEVADPSNAPKIPLNWAWKEAIIPAIIDHDPVASFRDADSVDDTKRRRAKLFEALSEYHWTKQAIRRRVVEPVVEECVPMGMAAALVEYDPIEDLSRAVFIPMRDVDMDLDANHPDIRFVRWVSIRRRIPVASASALWPNYQFTGDDGLSPGDEPEEHKIADGEMGSESGLVTVWTVFTKGIDPYTDERNQPGPKKDDRTPGDGALFTSSIGNRVVRYIAFAKEKKRGGGEKSKLCIVGEEPWEARHMPCYWDEFPVSFLRLTVDSESFWPRSMFDPVRGASDQANFASGYEDDDARQSVKRAVFVDESVITPDMQAKIRDSDGMTIIGVQGTRGLDAVKVVDFGNTNGTAALNADRSAARYEQVVRMNDLRPQPRSHESAAGIQQRGFVVDTRLARPGELVSEFAADVTRKLLACDRQHVLAARVAGIAGEHHLDFQTQAVTQTVEDPLGGDPTEEPVLDDDGLPEKVVFSAVWDDRVTGLAILDEVDLYMDPNAMVRLDKQTEIANRRGLLEVVQSAMGLLAQSGVAINHEAYAKFVFSFVADVAELSGVSDFAQRMPQASELFIFAPPEGGGDPGMNLTGQQQAAEGGAIANPPGS